MILVIVINYTALGKFVPAVLATNITLFSFFEIDSTFPNLVLSTCVWTAIPKITASLGQKLWKAD